MFDLRENTRSKLTRERVLDFIRQIEKSILYSESKIVLKSLDNRLIEFSVDVEFIFVEWFWIGQFRGNGIRNFPRREQYEYS